MDGTSKNVLWNLSLVANYNFMFYIDSTKIAVSKLIKNMQKRAQAEMWNWNSFCSCLCDIIETYMSF